MNNRYQLLDFYNERKFERWGKYILSRPCPVAIWKKEPKKQHLNIDGDYFRSSSGGGSWKLQKKLPDTWQIEYAGLQFIIKPTGFGHTGLFPEQYKQWEWFQNTIQLMNLHETKILNLFAYTGGSTLACLTAGASVTHVDAAKGVVEWGKENASINQLNNKNIRWIIDDVNKFVQKEIRRKNRYHGIILDPPSFGRGPKGEIWKFEEQIHQLLTALKKILYPQGSFFHFSCHTPGFTPLAMKELTTQIFPELSAVIESGEMSIPCQKNRYLPAGTYTRFINV